MGQKTIKVLNSFYLLLQVNGRDVSGLSHSDAVQVFQEAEEPIMVQVLRRPHNNNAPPPQTTSSSSSPNSENPPRDTSISEYDNHKPPPIKENYSSNGLLCTQGSQTDVSF